MSIDRREFVRQTTALVSAAALPTCLASKAHAAPGERRNTVRGNAKTRHIEGDRLGQAGDAQLGGGVISLTEIADQAGG